MNGERDRVEHPDEAMILVPLRDTVLFPETVASLAVGRRASVQAVEEAVKRGKPVGFVLQRTPETEEPGPKDLHEIGTSADVLQLAAAPSGERRIVVHGRERFRIGELLESEPFVVVRAIPVGETAPATAEFEARVLNLRQQALRALSLLPRPMPELAMLVENLKEPARLADLVASSLDVPAAEKQAVLETADLDERVKAVTEKLARQIEILELTRKIGSATKETLEKTQREYFLREQLKTIQRELGEGDAASAEAAELRRKIGEAKMPEEVERQALRELSRLEHMPEAAAERSVIRTYLDWLVELPWSIATDERIDIPAARAILEADHHDLDKVKRRILEFLAIRKLNPEGKSPILCFVGPPGVGKTSLGQSIARAMNRKFVRQSLGGIHDEAEIRGHRRTYVGALPGRIIQGIRKAGSRNPVFMLDEIDKLSASFQGDPNAALLEVLDPEQNHTFEDHYLDVPFDLREVTFIATANVLDSVPGALRDRMEVMELPGYSEEDKLEIARRYLIPRQIGNAGLASPGLRFEDGAVREVIRSYTREAGVRQLEREIAAICRGVGVRVAEGAAGPVTIGAGDVRLYLGPGKFYNEVALRTSSPGVATGLAWTATGGEILFIEASRVPGEGKLILTGHLGDVMKESAQAALTLVRSRARALEVGPDIFKTSDIHIHVPAGAIPKDGPSAGVAIFVALASLVMDRRVRHDVAMTGEISLRGLVLPVGGIKEKVLAAKRAGIGRVLLPALNRNDAEEIPAAVREALALEFLDDVDQALGRALEPQPAAEAA